MRNIVILGMHRSGTSMVAGALAAAGVYAGEDADLLADQQDNPHGFWERRDVVDCNDAILLASGGSWYQPPAQLAADGASQAALDAILAQLAGDHSYQIKDPRMVVTWPFWQQAVPDPVLLYVYRNPFAVAASLQRRNDFPLSFGFALWEYYNQLAIDTLQGRDAVCVSFDAIAANPQDTLNQLFTRLAELGVACDWPQGQRAFDTALGKSRAADQSLAEQLLSTSQCALVDYCEALCSGIEAPPRPVMAQGLLARIQDMASALAPLARVHETRNELAEASRLCAERTGERDESLRNLRQLEGEHSALAEAHHNEVSQHEKLRIAYRSFRTLEQKAEALFVELSQTYANLLVFEQSFLAGISRFTGRCYKLLTHRRGQRSSYDDALVDARVHFEKHDLPLPQKPARPPGKASLLGNVLSYVARNPAGSVRSFSLPRLKRAAAVFVRSTPEDLGVWVDSRFPNERGEDYLSIDDIPDESLDELQLVFPLEEQPRVSIVVPVYNEYRVTMRCLKSVLDNTAGIAYELILADDCSTDLTASIAERVSNLNIVRGDANRGFLANCNAAAEVARGEFVLFLNNDTAVCNDWLRPLLETLEQDETVGIVGPKLLFPDGRLQEAGGIIWRDASGWNFGRMDDPEKPEYNYRKEVDYISGACLMVRAGLWRQIGGFDERYRPAYYEDSDLAFEARKAGYKVVYQPLSRVFHFEGVSNGTDLGSGIKQYQVQNQAKFREKWQCELDEFHFPNAENVFHARDRSRGQRCILYIDHYVPHYDKDAGSRSTFMYIKLMLEMGYRVLFLGANFFPHRPYTQVLQQMGVEVLVGEYMARNQDRWLRDHAPYIDRIYLHRPHVAEQFLASLNKMKPRPEIIFFGHDLHYLRIEREYAVVGDEQLQKSAETWRKREYAVFDAVDKIYYPSQVEIDEITAQRPELNTRAIPLYAFDDAEAPEYDFSATRDILFVGGFNHPPNVDAICWFVEEVLPIITQSCPDIRLHVVGSNPTDAVEALQNEQVIVYGYLSDEELDALYSKVRQVVVPLRFGAGVKGKALEAIQKNRPMVTTSVGAEGIPDAETVMTIADSAQDFAASVIKVESGAQESWEKLRAYQPWLQRHFSKANARAIILQDFGAPGSKTNA
jgi:GT2 family glycosyltransferase